MVKKYLVFLCILLVIWLVSVNDAATSLSAGLAILLFGMLSLGAGFRVFNGGFLENILTTSTNNRFKAVTFGAVATAIMQSSSLVSVLSISFVSAALITLAQGIGVMFGANLGNSLGSWIIAWASGIKISALALPIIVGGVLFNFQGSKEAKGIGQILVGIGFFFLGVSYIKEGFEGFESMIDFSQYQVEGVKGVLIFVGLGALMTGIVQSSHATLTIIISAFVTGGMTYENALAATLGTSVGGVMTALIASLSTNIDGKRLAVANCIFNFAIAIVVIILFDYFVIVNDAIASLLGLPDARMSAEELAKQPFATLRIAVFHTLFNFVGICLMIAFIPRIAKFLEVVMEEKDTEVDKPIYLNKTIVSYPDTSLIALTNEVYHLYQNTAELIAHSLGFSRADVYGRKDMDKVLKKKMWAKDDVDIEVFYLKKIKTLFNAIVDFSAEAQANTQDKVYIGKFTLLTTAARHMVEAIKGMELLQPNLKKNAMSKTANIADEYNNIRVQLAMLLRSIQEINENRDIFPQEAIVKMKTHKKGFKKMDRESIAYVESLISKKEISVPNGTSLLNAIGFSHGIAKELTNAITRIQQSRIKDAQSSGKKGSGN